MLDTAAVPAPGLPSRLIDRMSAASATWSGRLARNRAIISGELSMPVTGCPRSANAS